jgi:PEP-CTERM motif
VTRRTIKIIFFSPLGLGTESEILGMSVSFKALALGAMALAAVAFASNAQAATCVGVSFGAPFAGSYTCDNVGTPTGVTGPLGGLTLLNANTLLVGGSANNSGGYIAQIGLIRDAGNHITGFSGPSTTFATAPNIDGGLAFGPGGVLFATGYSNNTLLQYRPGSTTPDKITTLDPTLASVGSLVFVPTGFAGAGGMKLLSYNNGNFANATLTPDGFGTFNVTSSVVVPGLVGGPEGAAYVKGTNAGFGGFDSLLVSEYGAGKVGTYQIDALGNPIAATRQDFIAGLGGAEGAFIDPLTGDFLFTTFGSGNALFVIKGFVAPPPPPAPGVPEPATWAMMLAGFGMVGASLRQRRRNAFARAIA